MVDYPALISNLSVPQIFGTLLAETGDACCSHMGKFCFFRTVGIHFAELSKRSALLLEKMDIYWALTEYAIIQGRLIESFHLMSVLHRVSKASYKQTVEMGDTAQLCLTCKKKSYRPRVWTHIAIMEKDIL